MKRNRATIKGIPTVVKKYESKIISGNGLIGKE
jgi:hypothetical protein